MHEQADATADAPRRVSASVLAALKPTCHLLNFARGDAVDGGALRARYDRKELIGRRAAAAASASTSTPPSSGCICSVSTCCTTTSLLYPTTAARPPSRPSLAPRHRYVADQPDAEMQGHPRFLCLPGLGAATSEAADNAVQMAATQLAQFLEQGTITSAPRNRSNHSNTNAPPD